jgi:hypothetical protein
VRQARYSCARICFPATVISIRSLFSIAVDLFPIFYSHATGLRIDSAAWLPVRRYRARDSFSRSALLRLQLPVFCLESQWIPPLVFVLRWAPDIAPKRAWFPHNAQRRSWRRFSALVFTVICAARSIAADSILLLGLVLRSAVEHATGDGQSCSCCR